jgi:hypothetical protein
MTRPSDGPERDLNVGGGILYLNLYVTAYSHGDLGRTIV